MKPIKRRHMEQRDYLQRQIEQAGKVLGQLLAKATGMKNKGSANEELEQVDQTLTNELDLSIGELTGIPVDQLVNTLLEKQTVFAENFEQLADLLVQLAESAGGTNGKHHAAELYQRALALYEYVDQTGSVFSFNRHSKMQKIRDLLEN